MGMGGPGGGGHHREGLTYSQAFLTAQERGQQPGAPGVHPNLHLGLPGQLGVPGQLGLSEQLGYLGTWGYLGRWGTWAAWCSCVSPHDSLTPGLVSQPHCHQGNRGRGCSWDVAPGVGGGRCSHRPWERSPERWGLVRVSTPTAPPRLPGKGRVSENGRRGASVAWDDPEGSASSVGTRDHTPHAFWFTECAGVTG